MTTTPQLGVNWDDVTAEITSVLRDYLRINTSNPPGNEQAAAEFLAPLLEAEGYECEYVEAGPGRVSMRTRLNGTGEERPLMLLNHTDVVPVQEEFWDVDPFAAVEQDGMLWGRGALDMKGMGTLELLVMLLFKRLNLTPNRDIVFLAVADEEAGSAYGMEWLDQNEQGWITEPEFALNEGGMGALNLLGSNRPVFACSPSEKSPLWLKLRAEGQPGHGSTPHSDNAVERLIRALFAIQNWDRAVTVQPHTAEAIQRMRDANAWAGSAPSLNKLCQTYPAFAAVTPRHHLQHWRNQRHQAQRDPGRRRSHARLPTLAWRVLRRLHQEHARRDRRRKSQCRSRLRQYGSVKQLRDRNGQRDRGRRARAG